MKLSELYWHRITPLHFILWPLSVLYGCFLALKKLCYWLDILPSVRLPVPVIVVDSISIDDGGKTPLIIWLVDCLLKLNYRPGIITRGSYDNPGLPAAVTSASNPTRIGEKAFLLAQRCGETCPVWIGNDRAAVAQSLLAAHPACNIIICNDGMQDYRLERNLEIAVVDYTEQSFGNGLLLPAGPLRATLRYLKTTDIIVTSGKQNHHVNTSQWGRTYTMKLVNETAYQLLNPEIRQPLANFKNKRLHAIASGDNAHRFFDVIQKTGLNAELHVFTENHRFVDKDIYFTETDVILMPEESALQCLHFAKHTLWALPTAVWIDSELQAIVLKKLNSKSG
jgi:tetraacyldisaccharide 4'-kinase